MSRKAVLVLLVIVISALAVPASVLAFGSSIPADLSPNVVESYDVQVFQEQQHASYEGQCVNSYLLHYDVPATSGSHDVQATITFPANIVEVFWTADDLDATDEEFGVLGVEYGPTPEDDRRLESISDPNGDNWEYSDNQFTIHNWRVSYQWRDQARVLTECPLIEIEIDIKPGSDPNCFNVNGHGVIPVAINGSADFDVNDVDVSSLSFGGLDVRVKGNGAAQCTVEDWNMDSYDDLVCQFVDDVSSWAPDNGTATLSGTLLDGAPIEGSDDICLTQDVPQ